MANQPQNNKVSQYAGMGLQLVAVVLVLVLSGKYLDEYLKYDALFLLIAIFIAVFATIYILIKKLG